jgi:hypothetical protein
MQNHQGKCHRQAPVDVVVNVEGIPDNIFFVRRDTECLCLYCHAAGGLPQTPKGMRGMVNHERSCPLWLQAAVNNPDNGDARGLNNDLQLWGHQAVNVEAQDEGVGAPVNNVVDEIEDNGHDLNEHGDDLNEIHNDDDDDDDDNGNDGGGGDDDDGNDNDEDQNEGGEWDQVVINPASLRKQKRVYNAFRNLAKR